MSRFFALGCSYTNYCFPTWADWLGAEFNHYENFGKSGMGNRAIFNRLCELTYKRNLTSSDTVVIAWSTPVREDRWYNDGRGWKSLGNIYNQPFYPDDWVEKYFDPFMGMMETINYVNASIHMLKQIGCKYIITWIAIPNQKNGHLEGLGPKSFLDICDPNNRLVDYFNTKILNEDKVCTTDIETFVKTFERKHQLDPIYTRVTHPAPDSHPKPLASYFYVKDILAPMLNLDSFDKNQKAFELAHQWQKYLSNSLNVGTASPPYPYINTHNCDFY